MMLPRVLVVFSSTGMLSVDGQKLETLETDPTKQQDKLLTIRHKTMTMRDSAKALQNESP
jgi:hypothetical protein